jgi:UDP-3-O-[3-hydroxymyristoyl] N-acetylglucosamine deacetylase
MTSTIGAAAVSYEGKGITSRQSIRISIEKKEAGHGIIFRIPDKKIENASIDIPATAASVVNTLRNVTLGSGANRLCLVEHILCAVALWGLDDLLIDVSGPEIPLGDGSANFWVDLLESSGWEKKNVVADLELKEPIIIKKGDRILMAIPDERFSVNYMMDWDHPQIGKCWQAWDSSKGVREITDARTFGSEKEHMILGIADEVVSMTADGFSKELRWQDEPVRHKLLDLIGDLILAGVNPQRWKARFISIKGGHEMDVEMAKKLAEFAAG